MSAGNPSLPKPARPGPVVPIDQLPGPDVANRPWQDLLTSEKPAVSLLSRCVPADFYFAEFRSIERLAATLDAGRAWLAFLSVQTAQDATPLPWRRRLEQQLVFQADDRALQPLVEQVAVTGSDPFLAEGSDVTVLVRLRADTIDAFRRRTERSLADAAAQPGAGQSPDKYRGIDYVYVATADHRLSAYAATLKSKGVHIRSNSRIALERVIDAALGESGLGATPEFQYIRTQLPLGDNEEDGLVYVPHALLQRLLGPAVQITQARRLVGLNHLRMIAHAAELYRTQVGKAPASLEELNRSGYTPGEFNKGPLASPFGGTYTLSTDGITGVCSVLGTADNLKPCYELVVQTATADEADSYREFVKDFGMTGRQWLAPAALRLQAGPRHVRVEALLLPPADKPVRAVLGRVVGGSPEPLDPLPVPRRTIASIGLRLNKDRWINERLTAVPRPVAAVGQFGAALASSVHVHAAWSAAVAVTAHDFLVRADAPLADLAALGIEPARVKEFLERGIGNQAGLHFGDAAVPFDLSLPTLACDLFGAGDRRELGVLSELGFLAGTLSGPVYIAIPVQNAPIVDDFLDRLDAGLARKAPTWRDRLFGTPLHGEFYHLTSKAGLPMRSLGVRAGPTRYRLFWARIGDGLYIANQPAILDELQSATRQLKTASSDRGPTAHAMLKLRPANLSLALPGMRLGWEEANREACQRNVAMLSAAARAFSFTPPVSTVALDQETRERLVLKYATQLYGCDFACPDGGRYVLAEDGKSCACSMHGAATRPRQPDRPAAGGPERLTDVTATLTLTQDGLRVVLTLTQK